MLKKTNVCEICNKESLKTVLDLGRHPLCDDLIPIGNKKKNKLYKINICFCNNCFTAFQKFNVSKIKLFPKSYHYRAKLTKDVTNGMKNLVFEVKKKVKNLKKKKVLDIGCNDGSLLDLFKKEGCTTIGIEPTNAYKDANRNKHNIYNNYFAKEVIKKIKKKYQKIDIITFTNVFAHIENFRDLIDNLKELCSVETLIVIENHYLGAVIKKNQFDTFYHEHPRTYSLKSFLKMQELLNMKLTYVSFPKRYSGNIRVFFETKGESVNYNKHKKKEKKFMKQLTGMKVKIKKWKNKKLKLIKKITSEYGPLPAKAFPGRAAIILKLLNLSNKTIKCVYEKNNSPKINNYVPGTRIPIISEKNLFKENSKIPIINLAWHIPEEIKNYLIKLGIKNPLINIIEDSDFK